MMFLFRLGLMLCFCAGVWAEETPVMESAVEPVDKSPRQLTVDNINKTTEILRDPTQMSGNFRQALKNMTPAQVNPTGSAGAAPVQTLPVIELTGKVVCRHRPGTAVLRVAGQPFHITQGNSISIFHNGALMTLRVDEVSADHVHVYLVERSQTLILR